MSSVQIKANQELFNRFTSLSYSIKYLQCIVQNDMEVHSAELRAWAIDALKVQNELKELITDVQKYVNGVEK